MSLAGILKKAAGPFSKIPAAYKLKCQFVQARDYNKTVQI